MASCSGESLGNERERGQIGRELGGGVVRRKEEADGVVVVRKRKIRRYDTCIKLYQPYRLVVF